MNEQWKKNKTSVHQYITLLHETITVRNGFVLLFLLFYVFVTPRPFQPYW